MCGAGLRSGRAQRALLATDDVRAPFLGSEVPIDDRAQPVVHRRGAQVVAVYAVEVRDQQERAAREEERLGAGGAGVDHSLLGAAGDVVVACGQASGTTQFVLDVTGYFQ